MCVYVFTNVYTKYEIQTNMYKNTLIKESDECMCVNICMDKCVFIVQHIHVYM